jgi:hypothetical protein
MVEFNPVAEKRYKTITPSFLSISFIYRSRTGFSSWSATNINSVVYFCEHFVFTLAGAPGRNLQAAFVLKDELIKYVIKHLSRYVFCF